MKEKNIGKRIFAGLLDYIMIFTFFYFFTYTFGEPNIYGEYELNGYLAFIPLFFWLFITVGIEQILGATIGNFIVDLKPVSLLEDGEKPTILQSLKRHILAPIDMLFLGIIGIIIIKNTEKNQRLGDLWANTTVVKIE